MKQNFKLAFFAIIILFASCNLSAQQKDNYSTKIDGLLKTKNPRNFNLTHKLIFTGNGVLATARTRQADRADQKRLSDVNCLFYSSNIWVKMVFSLFFPIF
ncbi:hypothetical protein AR687_24890 [Flavobacteriaceae bacterium CRH]|nr:hypothetical protein AR687_24890 [Flavobacteriaceae bacterium CRH]